MTLVINDISHLTRTAGRKTMRRVALAVSCVVVVVPALLIACSRSPAGTPPAKPTPAAATAGGDWVGGFRAGDDWVYLQLHVRQDGNDATGTFDLPLEFRSGVALDGVTVTSDGVRFEIARGGDGGRWRFDGRADG